MNNIKRSDFLSTLFGVPVAVKAMDMKPRPDGKPPLLVFETREKLQNVSVEKLREALGPQAEKHGFEFIILHGGMTVKRVL